MVEPVARSQRCRDWVSAFQKAKTWMSRNWPAEVGDDRRDEELPADAEHLVELGVGVIAVRVGQRQLRDVEDDEGEHCHPHPEQRQEARALRPVELVDDVGEEERDREGEEPDRHRLVVPDAADGDVDAEGLASGEVAQQQGRDEDAAEVRVELLLLGQHHASAVRLP
jgi:hypothetical protein